jgi:hypothetical protein
MPATEKSLFHAYLQCQVVAIYAMAGSSFSYPTCSMLRASNPDITSTSVFTLIMSLMSVMRRHPRGQERLKVGRHPGGLTTAYRSGELIFTVYCFTG